MHLKSQLAAAALACAASSAFAIPSVCTLGTLTATFADTTTASYTDCTGAWDGNLAPSGVTQLQQIIQAEFALPGASYVGTSGKPDSPWTNDPGSVGAGVLNFAAAMSGLFVVGLHAGDQDAPVYPGIPVPGGGDFSLYLFDGNGHGGILSIAFDTKGVSLDRQGSGRNLSHATLYGSPLVPQEAQVPEPGSLSLLALSLAAAAALRRRRA